VLLRKGECADPALGRDATEDYKVATDALAKTGVPSASVAVVKDWADRLFARLWKCPARSCHTGEARNALTALVDQQAVYGCGHPALQEQGKLSLDDKVGKFIPSITRANEVTIRQLLSHTSGYQDYWPQDYVMPLMLQPVTAQEDSGHLGAQAARF